MSYKICQFHCGSPPFRESHTWMEYCSDGFVAASFHLLQTVPPSRLAGIADWHCDR